MGLGDIVDLAMDLKNWPRRNISIEVNAHNIRSNDIVAVIKPYFISKMSAIKIMSCKRYSSSGRKRPSRVL